MPVDAASESAQYTIPNLPEGGPHVFFGDVLGSKNMTGSYFLLKGPNSSTPPPYTYDESGVIIKGDFTIKDETGYTISLKAGDVFFIHAGSTITFSTSNFGLAYKTSSRPHSKLEKQGKL